MKKVMIKPGCITCGTCEFIAPELFEVTDICRVKTVDVPAAHEKELNEAIQRCPVNVITSYEEDPS